MSNLIAKATATTNAPADKVWDALTNPATIKRYTHFSPLSGVPGKPENYHTVTIELSSEGNSTRLVLTQDNNPTEQAREHSTTNWEMMLANLKKGRRGVNG